MRDDDLQLLASEYTAMTDAELLAAAAEFNDMVEPAQQLLQAEFARRNLALHTPAKPEPSHHLREFLQGMLDTARGNLGMAPISRVKPTEYSKMSVRDLLETARGYDQLNEPEQARLREEFQRRALVPPTLEDDTQPEPPPDPGDVLKMVTVGQYRDLSEAIVARAVLEEAGITCFLRDENLVRMDWLWSNLIGGMRLDVEEKDAAAATALLAEPMPASFPVDSGPDFQQPVCPNCGSVDVVANDSDRKVLAASLFIGLPLPHRRPLPNTWKCNTCGTRWQDDGKPAESETNADTP